MPRHFRAGDSFSDKVSKVPEGPDRHLLVTKKAICIPAGNPTPVTLSVDDDLVVF
jgi:hypothetical protein